MTKRQSGVHRMTDEHNEDVDALRTDAGMSESWRRAALHIRDKVEHLVGEQLPRCLPDEPEACGSDYAHHLLSYVTVIKAHGEWMIQHFIEDAPETGRAMADELYEAHLRTALEHSPPHGLEGT